MLHVVLLFGAAYKIILFKELRGVGLLCLASESLGSSFSEALSYARSHAARSDYLEPVLVF